MNILGIAPRRSVNKIGVYMVFDFLKKKTKKKTQTQTIVNKRLLDNSRYVWCLAMTPKYNVIVKTLRNMDILGYIFIYMYIGQLLKFTDSTVHLHLFINMITNYNYSVDSIFKSTQELLTIVYIYRILVRFLKSKHVLVGLFTFKL